MVPSLKGGINHIQWRQQCAKHKEPAPVVVEIFFEVRALIERFGKQQYCLQKSHTRACKMRPMPVKSRAMPNARIMEVSPDRYEKAAIYSRLLTVAPHPHSKAKL